ncbi:MAG TPA: hypothetical protein VH762_11260 [Gemmatimonadaceae bacterium]
MVIMGIAVAIFGSFLRGLMMGNLGGLASLAVAFGYPLHGYEVAARRPPGCLITLCRHPMPGGGLVRHRSFDAQGRFVNSLTRSR